MGEFREKFNLLHRELSNCQSEILLIRQQNIDSEDSQKEYQRLDKRIGEIEKELKNLSLDKDY